MYNICSIAGGAPFVRVGQSAFRAVFRVVGVRTESYEQVAFDGQSIRCARAKQSARAERGWPHGALLVRTARWCGVRAPRVYYRESVKARKRS